ncbi:MAG: SDR family NAD(P)-dependent oxidoreductase, partial [Pseudohongiellaceae bacterium]
MNAEQKVALVTGASRGIGRAITLALGEQNLIVIGTATTAEGAGNISSYLREAGIKGQGIQVDVSSDESVAACFDTIEERYRSPAVLVNNAGVTRDNLLLRMKP